VIGLETTERVAGRFVFMSFGAEHHDLALQQIRGRWGSTFAVEVDGERELPMRSIASSRLASPTGRSTTGSRRRSISRTPTATESRSTATRDQRGGGVTRPLDPATLRRDTQGLGFQGRHQGGDPVASRGSTGQQSAIAGV
jgi:catechol-2,3-dioxygenase